MAEENIPESPEDRKARHTPGPWQYQAESADRVVEIWSGDGVTRTKFVCDVPNNPGEDHANARLIAAAPDLLAALTQVSEAHESWAALARPEYGIEFDDPLSDAVKQAREAIAKAEGE